jgi:hypothetical protein
VGKAAKIRYWFRTVGDVEHDIFVVKVEFPFPLSIGQITGIFLLKGSRIEYFKNFTFLVCICFSRTDYSVHKYYSKKENFIFHGFLGVFRANYK